MRTILMVLAAMVISIASAIEIPKASGKALGVSRGRAFSEGLVFINGKYLEPPYVVERWGTGIRINGTPVIGQIVDWSDFLKTQSGVKVTKTESTPAAAEPEPEPEVEEEVEEEDDTDSSLDDLFDDDPKPAKKAVKKPTKKKKVAKKRPPKPTTTVSYVLDGDFVMNDAAKALVARVNKIRTDLNATLLKGGILIFGDRYARVSADTHSAEQVLSALPDILKQSTSADDVLAAARAAGLVYLTPPICADLYANKIDYLKLQRRKAKWQEDKKFKSLINNSGSKPLF